MSSSSKDPLSEPLNPPPPPPPPAVMSHDTPIKVVPCHCLSDAESELESHILFELKRHESPDYGLIWKCFRSVTPKLQDGPKCGMVALAMALPEDYMTQQDLKEMAAARGWTQQGEMFSCEWMGDLARLVGVSRVVCISNGLDSHLNCIADCIANGGYVLVPYDKTQNHSPGLRGGKSAHWAVITGLVVLKSSDQPLDGNLKLQPCKCSGSSHSETIKSFKILNCSTKYGISLTKDSIFVQKLAGGEDSAAVYVCAYQGLSRHVNLWPFSLLCASNNNLKELDPSRKGMVLPSGGVEGGLCGKAVLLYPSD